LQWPCVEFLSKKELRNIREHLLQSSGHGREEESFYSLDLSRDALNNRGPPSQQGAIKVAYYLLGKKTPGNKRLVFEPELSDFQYRSNVVRSRFGSEPGFEEAHSEAFKLFQTIPNYGGEGC
jgi:hypothetical protein